MSVKEDFDTMHKLEVCALTKCFGDTVAVDRVSFYVDDGEFFVLLGPTGSGKTTIMRMLCGLETPDTGCVLIDECDVTRWPAGQRNIGAILQGNYGLYPLMDVYENIAFGLRCRRCEPSGIEMHVVATAQMLGITHLLGRKIDKLSEGERQRVALARMQVRNVALALFDEPLLHLDAPLRHQARQEILMMHRLARRTCIYVTHDQVEGFSIAHRIGVLVQGRLQQVGTPHDLLYRPANTLVARFVGTPPMNLICGYPQSMLRHRQLGYRILAGSLCLYLPDRWTRMLQTRKMERLLVGIRPDAIVPEWMWDTSDRRPYQIMRAQVIALDQRTRGAIATLLLGGKCEVLSIFCAPIPRIGQEITVGIDAEQICLFQQETGERLIPDSEESSEAMEGRGARNIR
jgi:multiple sugar transport system ATP-binding protein